MENKFKLLPGASVLLDPGTANELCYNEQNITDEIAAQLVNDKPELLYLFSQHPGISVDTNHVEINPN